MKTLLIATSNLGKIEELLALLADLPANVLTPEQLGIHLEIVEDGETYAANASKKALAHARAAGLTALADDTGLEVVALQGAPGLHSKRYAGRPDATDADRRAKLLAELRGVARPWQAAFRATIAVASPAGDVRLSDGACEGEIIPDERGSGGFGYDAIFLPRGETKTIAEMSLEEKNRISHRARAVRSARQHIIEMLTG